MKLFKKLVAGVVGTAMVLSMSAMAFAADYAGFYKVGATDEVSMVTLAIDQTEGETSIVINEDEGTIYIPVTSFKLAMGPMEFTGTLTDIETSQRGASFEFNDDHVIFSYNGDFADLYEEDDYVLATVKYITDYSSHVSENQAYFGLSTVFPEYKQTW